MTASHENRLRSLRENGDVTQIMIEAEKIMHMPNKDELWQSIDAVYEPAQKSFLSNAATSSRNVLNIMSTTDCPETFAACALLLVRHARFDTLIASKSMPNRVDKSVFGFRSTDAFIDTLLFNVFVKEPILQERATTIKGEPIDLILYNGFARYRRRTDAFVPARTDNCQRINLGKNAWATAFDTATNTVICTLSTAQKVLAYSLDTKAISHVLQVPSEVIRGLWLHPTKRIGYVASENHNCIHRFNLDTFEIEKTIEGCSVRPERVYADPDTETLITGNLGIRQIHNGLSDYYASKSVTKLDGKITDGQSITVVDIASDTVIDTLPTGIRPTAIAISATYIAAGNFAENTLSVYRRDAMESPVTIPIQPVEHISCNFDLPDRDVALTARSRLIEGIKILDRRGWLLVSGFDGCFLSIVDLNEQTVIDVVLVHDTPFDVVVDEDEKYAYVACYDSGDVSVVDLDARQEVLRIAVGEKPQDLSLTARKLIVPVDTGVTIVDLDEIAPLLDAVALPT